MWSTLRTATAGTSSFRAGLRSAGPAAPRKQIEGIKRSRAAREIRGIDHAEEVRTQLEDLTIDLPARAGDTGKLFAR